MALEPELTLLWHAVVIVLSMAASFSLLIRHWHAIEASAAPLPAQEMSEPLLGDDSAPVVSEPEVLHSLLFQPSAMQKTSKISAEGNLIDTSIYLSL